MSWSFSDDRPIWIQLNEQLTLQIVSGIYNPGDALPSVRTLAAEAGVNPNTMQRAMAELESQGLIETKRTAGRIVTEDMQLISQTRNKLALERVREFMQSMQAMGYKPNEIKQLWSEWEQEEKL